MDFQRNKTLFSDRGDLDPPTVEMRVSAAKQHLLKSIEWKGEKIGVAEMRRHYANYFRGLENIKPFRARLVTEYDVPILLSILEEINEIYSENAYQI